MRFLALPVAVILAFSALISPAHADEFYLCEDGRTIQLNASNREKYRNEPCVAEWFKSQKAKDEVEKAKAAAAPITRMQGIPAFCKQPWDCPHLH